MTSAPMISDDTAIINYLRKLPDNTMITEDGPLGYLISSLGGEAEIIVINNGKKLQVMYIDHDHVISYVQPEKAHFEVEKNENGLLLNIYVPTDQETIRLPLMFNLRTKVDLDTLQLIARKKRINVNFICIEHGGLVKSSHAAIAITRDVIKQLS